MGDPPSPRTIGICFLFLYTGITWVGQINSKFAKSWQLFGILL